MAVGKQLELTLKTFKADKVKNANIIVDFLHLLEGNDVKDIKSGVNGLQAIFLYLLQNGDIETPSELPEDLMRASQKFNSWLFERYNEVFEKFLGLLNHEESTVRELVLSSVIALMKVEGKYLITKKEDNKYLFPSSRLQALLDKLMSEAVDHEQCIKLLKEHMECGDFMLHAVLSLSVIVKKYKKHNVTEVFMNNIILMLEQVNIPHISEEYVIYNKWFLEGTGSGVSSEDGESSMFKISYAKIKKGFNIVWRRVLTYPLTSNLFRRCLVFIPDRVMQHLDKPLQLNGFFMEAYDLGGAISLLALQGVFILINKYNLDYPNFYQKLYGLLEPTVFHAKYRPRFFMLLNLFLSSSHIPQYTVAAFIKRLSRMSLVAPACCLVLVMKFIANLLIRFPGLQMLIHNPNANSLENDPFDPDEPDLSKCGACESSLWEVATLQEHVLPKINKSTGFLEKTLPLVEYDISELVETSYEEVYENSCKLKIHEEVSRTFYKPTGLFTHHDDKMSDVWSVL